MRREIFLKKFNPSGKTIWTKRWGTYWGNGTGVTSDFSGSVYVTGNTQGGLDGNKHFGKFDSFLVKFSW